MSKPRVWNKRDPKTPKDAIYVGRPSRYASPFIVSKTCSKKQAEERYRKWLSTNSRMLSIARRDLGGHDLVSWQGEQDYFVPILFEMINKDAKKA